MDDDEIDRIFGAEVRRRRLRLGIKQEAFVEKVDGLTQGRLSTIENGGHAGIHIRRGIAKAFGITLQELFGLSEPIKFRDTYRSVAQQLLHLGIPRHEFFQRAHFFETNPDRRCVDTTVCITPLRGHKGLGAELIAVEETCVPAALHQCVRERLDHIGNIGADRTKVALTSWSQAPIDADGGKLKLRLSPMKYSVKLAMRAAGTEVLQEVVDRNVTILSGENDAQGWPARLLPCLLHCDGLVLSGDGHVLLTQRSDEVEIERQRWAASFGEGMEWDKDRGSDGSLHPLETIYRGLDEELGIDREWIEEHVGERFKVSFLNLGFQLDNLVYVLFSLIELPQVFIEELKDHARSRREDGGEIYAVASMDFTPEACASAVTSGVVDGRKLINAARFAIMLAAQNKFPTQFALALERNNGASSS